MVICIIRVVIESLDGEQAFILVLSDGVEVDHEVLGLHLSELNLKGDDPPVLVAHLQPVLARLLHDRICEVV